HVVETLNDASLKSQYIKNKSFDDDYFKKMIIDYLRKFNTASRKEIDNLLREKLSDVLTEEQKTNKIGNLLKKLRMKNIIVVTQNKHWRLV
ncbi:MAG: AAA family ATPase, partial [Sodaliphilus sp.]|nr:AAA family ATPase [Sodaliphilus sp.]